MKPTVRAVRWLNDHTTDEFEFFAVRMRVVRIGDSPFAPIFEVLEKPNAWERALERKFKQADSELTRLREGFWDRYLERHPGVFRPSRYSNVWLPMYPDDSVLLSMYVGSAESGMFLRGRWGADGTETLRSWTPMQKRWSGRSGPTSRSGRGTTTAARPRSRCRNAIAGTN